MADKVGEIGDKILVCGFGLKTKEVGQKRPCQDHTGEFGGNTQPDGFGGSSFEKVGKIQFLPANEKIGELGESLGTIAVFSKLCDVFLATLERVWR